MTPTDPITKYLPLLAVGSAYLPTLSRRAIVVRTDDTKIECDSVRYTNTHVIADQVVGVQSIPISSVKYIRHTTRLEYPILPPGINTPDRDHKLAWVVAGVQAIASDISSSISQDIIITVKFNFVDHYLQITVGSTWSDIPAFIRHRVLDNLYDKVVVMAKHYRVPAGYCRLYLYDSDGRCVGSRTSRTSQVLGGIPTYYREITP